MVSRTQRDEFNSYTKAVGELSEESPAYKPFIRDSCVISEQLSQFLFKVIHLFLPPNKDIPVNICIKTISLTGNNIQLLKIELHFILKHCTVKKDRSQYNKERKMQ
jgi:hypothetical protein